MKDIDIIIFVAVAIFAVKSYADVCIMLTLYDILKVLKNNHKALKQMKGEAE